MVYIKGFASVQQPVLLSLAFQELQKSQTIVTLIHHYRFNELKELKYSYIIACYFFVDTKVQDKKENRQ